MQRAQHAWIAALLAALGGGCAHSFDDRIPSPVLDAMRTPEASEHGVRAWVEDGRIVAWEIPAAREAVPPRAWRALRSVLPDIGNDPRPIEISRVLDAERTTWTASRPYALDAEKSGAATVARTGRVTSDGVVLERRYPAAREDLPEDVLRALDGVGGESAPYVVQGTDADRYGVRVSDGFVEVDANGREIARVRFRSIDLRVR